ncbi:MAG TPA: LPS assembly lipoprotein LptE, partial [Candidatus Binatia bacterium]|nr:LPS assembly lipoprotein LptE [Candidatus Binatia bacterium]
GNLPDDVANIRVAHVEVGDGDPLLADALARELRRVLRWRGRFRPVDANGAADAVLTVRVTTDRTRAVAFDEFDDVLDYQSTLAVDAELSRPGGESLWKGARIAATRGHAAVPGAVVTSSAAFQGQETLDEQALERFHNVQLGEERRAEARERAIRDLAEAIYSRMTEGL